MNCTQKREDYLDQLIELGYGETRPEVCEYLIRRSIDDLLRARVIGQTPQAVRE